MITIKQGDIFTENEADFIVNPSNTSLFLGSGVSRAFKLNCDKDLQSEMKKIAPIKQGEVVITKCNDKFKHALHVAVMDYSKPNPNPTYEIIKMSLKHIIEILKNHPGSKIVLPLMGTGVGGLDKEKVIKIYKNTFSNDADMACEIIIYGYKKKDYEKLRKIFKI